MTKFPSVSYHIHWANKCPHKSSNQHENILEEANSESNSETKESNIVLITEEISKNKIF